jgi:hypothetical protein
MSTEQPPRPNTRTWDDDGTHSSLVPPILSEEPSFSIDTANCTRIKTKHRLNPWVQHWASITPLIVGGLGPTITLLAISGCADAWRVDEFPNGIHVSEKDKKWVIACTAIAIVVGFFANLFLLFRMVGRGSPKYMQYLSISLWSLECIVTSSSI